MKIKKTLTYSMWAMWLTCRKKAFYRYEMGLVAEGRNEEALYFGSLIHDCLEIWHGTYDSEKVFGYINHKCLGRDVDDREKKTWHYASAMMRSYIKTYPTETFKVIALEKEFSCGITNPATGALSKSFVFSGKMDGIVEQDGDEWLLEHKTAIVVGGAYLDKLWTDMQIKLYSMYARKLGHDIKGVLYNVLQKPKLKQKEGETEEEFETRHAGLCKKSKSGKSSAKRSMPETDEDFATRLDNWYENNDTMTRQELMFGNDDYLELEESVWEFTQQLLDCKRRKVWYNNPTACEKWGRMCQYYKICSAKNKEMVIENLYEVKPVHSELEQKELELF